MTASPWQLRAVPMTRWSKAAFAIVVLHGLAQYTLGESLTAAPLRSLALAAVATAYVALACHDRLRSWAGRAPLPYLLLQNALGLALPWIGLGYTAMAPLAVISLSAMVLPGLWVLVPGLVQTGNVVWACLTLVPGELGHQLIYIFMSAVVFVAAFTKAVMSEMQLREQLDAASKRLALQAEQAKTLATLAERERIARELHDSLGHAMVAAHVHLLVAERDLLAHPERATEAVRSARGAVHAGLDDLRRTVRTLKHKTHEALDLQDALQRLVASHGQSALRMSFVTRGAPVPIAQHVALALYRVAQEAITNAIKHAAGSRVEVALRWEPTALELCVADDGRGRRGAAEGFGLAGIRERLAELGGELSLHDEPGLRLCAVVPLTSDELQASSRTNMTTT